jgi:hypothetical protein
MNINDAIKTMKLHVKDTYAQTYLNAIPDAIDQGGTQGLCTQLLYVLENCKSWKGKVAQETKKAVKDWISEKSCPKNV